MKDQVRVGFMTILVLAVAATAALGAEDDTFGSIRFVRPAKACFCEFGAEPAAQSPAFRVGCEMWFATQDSCSIHRVVPQGTDYSRQSLPEGTTELSIGYVGHWSDSRELIEYLRRSIVPLLDRGYSVSLDNSACRGMNRPDTVADFVASLRLRRGQHLDIKGNQTISVGQWDVVFGKGANFWAKVSSRRPGVVEYPDCAAFLGKNCLIQAQENENGTCRGTRSFETLRCCYHSDSHSTAGQLQDTIWQPPENCEPYKKSTERLSTGD